MNENNTLTNYDIDFSWIEVDKKTAIDLENQSKEKQIDFLIEQVKNGNLYIVSIEENCDPVSSSEKEQS